MSKLIYGKREGYWGIISIPYNNVLALFSGELTLNVPGEVKVHTINNSQVSASLHVIVTSDEPIYGVTFECEEGTEIPMAFELEVTRHKK